MDALEIFMHFSSGNATVSFETKQSSENARFFKAFNLKIRKNFKFL